MCRRGERERERGVVGRSGGVGSRGVPEGRKREGVRAKERKEGKKKTIYSRKKFRV